MILNCDNSWRDPFKRYLPTSSPLNSISQQERPPDLSFGAQDKKWGLQAMLEDAERELGPKLAKQKFVT